MKKAELPPPWLWLAAVDQLDDLADAPESKEAATNSSGESANGGHIRNKVRNAESGRHATISHGHADGRKKQEQAKKSGKKLLFHYKTLTIEKMKRTNKTARQLWKKRRDMLLTL